MANIPKISHYASADSSIAKPASSLTPDRSRLARLYPEPKTYSQRKKDDKLRQKAYRLRWPKRPHLNIAAYGSVLLGLSVWFSQNINSWWFGSSNQGITMATVFFTFAMVLLLAALIAAWVKYVNSLFEYFGGFVQVFWLTHAVIVSLLIILCLSGWTWHYTDSLWVPSLAILYFNMSLFGAIGTIGKR